MAQEKFQRLNYLLSLKKLICSIFFISAILVFPSKIFAESDYVLPYPPVMPGGIQYKIRLVIEELQKYWYFGDFGQLKYNLKQSDKYIVQAKVLFEYKQYLLAYQALESSNKYFNNLTFLLASAKKNDKDISLQQKEIQKAAIKHQEILIKIKQETPESVTWKPEKEKEILLSIWELIRESIKIRESVL